MINKLTIANQLVDLLASYGITVYFGIPGGPVSPVFDAVLQSKKARLIESRQETAAAFAAAAYYEETGKVAAIIVTAGPGGTNAVTGVTSAYLKKIPMIVICGDVAWTHKGERFIQDSGPNGIHMESIYSSITKKTIRIKEPEKAMCDLSVAVEVCQREENAGPVLIMLPMQIARSQSSEEAIGYRGSNETYITTYAKPGLSELIQVLFEANKPLVVVGNGCRKYAHQLTSLIELLGIPVITTPQAKGLISEDHALSLRHGGIAASWWARRYCNEGEEVDVCLALATDLDDCATGPVKYIGANTKLIHIDNDPDVFLRNYDTWLTVEIHISHFMGVLIDQLKESSFQPRMVWRKMVEEIKSSSPFDQPDFQMDESVIISPHRAIADIQEVMPKNTRYITDIGEHMLFALHYLTITQPDTFHFYINLGSMGSGIAGAVGLAVGNPHKPVVCICGDGGMEMMGMEIIVAKKMKLPIIYAVFNDGRYNMVYHGFRTMYGYDHPWDNTFIDFTIWGRSLGVTAHLIQHPKDLTKAMIQEAMEKSEPIILDMRINKDIRISGAGRDEHLQHMSVSQPDLVETITR